MSAELMRLSQLPQIEERLRDVKAEWEQTTAENMSLVCTADTIQSVKAARAEMTKRFEAIELNRKALKARYMERWDEFTATYKECITDVYNRADADLKRKIDETEGAIKAECEERCVAYFRELCAVHGVDFVSWPQLNIKVDLTSAKQKTPRKLFDAISEKVAAITDGMDKIDREADPTDRDEIMAEYKQCLDVGAAVLRVQDRKNRLKAEQQAAAEREERRRASGNSKRSSLAELLQRIRSARVVGRVVRPLGLMRYKSDIEGHRRESAVICQQRRGHVLCVHVERRLDIDMTGGSERLVIQ